jgi:hypothetical protein
MKGFDPLIDPTIPFPPKRRINIGIGPRWNKMFVVPEFVYQFLLRLTEKAKRKAADDWHRDHPDNQRDRS